MNPVRWLQRILLLLFVALSIPSGFTQIRLPRLISDGAVLQRDAPNNIWGWASPGEEIQLALGDQTLSTTTDSDGRWQMELPPQPAGGPHELTLTGSNQITLQNILFGDVWVCSGQSNMELTMERVKEKYPEVIASAANPEIRQFLVPDQFDFKGPHEDVSDGNWTSADPQTVLGFSAVAYFFARELNQRYDVPIGLINSAMGGSPVEAWMSEEALKPFPAAYNEMIRFRSDSLIEAIEQGDRERISSWYATLNEEDLGLKQSPAWSEEEVEDADWQTMPVPGKWSDAYPDLHNGVFWYRKTVTVPADWAGKSASLWLGRIVDADEAYVNGQKVGNTTYQYPPRRYQVPAGILKAGVNTIAVRVTNSSGTGGFIPNKPYFLAVGADTMDLQGEWKFRKGADMEPLGPQTFIRWKPGGLYNKMIAPLLHTSIKGVIWYQGESNTGNPGLYGKTFPAMIHDWRSHWDQTEPIPFLFVQLANYMEATTEPVESNWAALRQSQLKTLDVPNTGMATIIDLGEWNDIHPLNKSDVGHRLALQARIHAYGEEVPGGTSPIPATVKFREKIVSIVMDNPGSELQSADGQPIRHFTVSGDGKTFFKADAKVDGNSITVHSDEVPQPIAVRYAWANNPEGINLVNDQGLPASPFEASVPVEPRAQRP